MSIANDHQPLSRRRFLRQSFAFSAAAALSGAAHAFAAPSSDSAAHMLMIGDWGYEKDEAQRQVAAGMISYTRQNGLPIESMLFLGDSWYGDLPGGADSPRWQANFEQLYPSSIFPGPIYSIGGNHDYQHMPAGVNKLEAELAYASRGNTRFTFPSLWYRFTFPQHNPLITFLALDSNMHHHTLPPNFTLTSEQQADQLRWLTAELEKPLSTPFLVVMAHHPIYSNGLHGDHEVLKRDWDPLLRKHNVHVYLAGHDHDLQHLEFDGHPTSFFLSGGGGADLYNLRSESINRGPMSQKVYGFSHLEVTPHALTLRHLDETGKLLHAFTKSPDGSIRV